MGRYFDSTDNLSADYDYGPGAYPFTISAWGYVTGTNYVCLCCLQDKDSDTYYTMLDIATGAVRAFSAAYGGTAASAVTSTTLTAGQWFHGAGVWNSVSSRIAYLNGGGKIENTGTVGALANHDRTAIGARMKLTPVYSNGAVAEVAIWNVALTDEEIATLAAGCSPLLVRPASLMNYWPLCDTPITFGGPEYVTSWKAWNYLTVSGSDLTDHPPIVKPRGLRIWTPAAAAPASVRRPAPVWMYGG